MIEDRRKADYDRQLGKITSSLSKQVILMRKSWLYGDTKTLRFSYDRQKNRYVYAHSGANVGANVLDADDIIVATCKSTEELVEEHLNLTQESKMNKNYIGEYNRVALVSYDLVEDGPNLSTYSFKLGDEVECKEGDLVIVDGKNGLKIARVIEVMTRSVNPKIIKQFNLAKAWVVCKIEEEKHKQRAEATERKKFILRELEERKEQIEEIAIYDMLAKADPQAAKLLEELKKLS